MSKLWPCLLLFLCACCLFTSIFLLTVPFEAPSSAPATYYLRDWNGCIALFESNNSLPSEVYPVYTHLLPPSDVESLRKGIPLSDKEHVNRLLEDFGG